MTYRATFLGCLFLLIALALAACEVLGVYEYVVEQRSSLYVALGSCIIAAVTPALPALSDWFWRSAMRRYCAAGWVIFGLCLLLVTTAAIQRTGSATDGAQHAREAAERAASVAAMAEKQATGDYESAQAAALRECNVRGKRCMDAEDKAASARGALAKARASLVSAPVSGQADPIARRLASFLPISEERVRLLQPLLLPIILSALSAVLFAGWSRLDFMEADSKPAPAAEAPQKPAETPRRPALALVQEKPRAVRAGKFGSLAAFLVSCTEAAKGAEIAIEAVLYGAYCEWCRIGSVDPYDQPKFALELAHVAQSAGILIELRGTEAYCLDRRLAA